MRRFPRLTANLILFGQFLAFWSLLMLASYGAGCLALLVEEQANASSEDYAQP